MQHLANSLRHHSKMSDLGVTFPDAKAPEQSPEHRLDTLLAAPGYWTALAMQDRAAASIRRWAWPWTPQTPTTAA